MCSLLALTASAAASDLTQAPIEQVSATVEQVETQVATTTASVAEVDPPAPQSIPAPVGTTSDSPAAPPSVARAPKSGAADHVPTLHADGDSAGEAVDTVTASAPSIRRDEGQVGGNRGPGPRDASEIVASAVGHTVDRVQRHALQPVGATVGRVSEAVRQVSLAERLSEVTGPITQLTGPLQGALTSLLDVAAAPTVASLLSPEGSGEEAPPTSGLFALDVPALANPLGPRGFVEVGGPSLELEHLVGLPLTEPAGAKLEATGEERQPPAATLPEPRAAAAGDEPAAAASSGARVPLEVPAPAPTPGAGAAGSGASFFVPLAALLALLALVAPATLRRLREVPGFPAPTPFVCALERPG